MRCKYRLKNLLIGLDQFLWVLITLGAGRPDETISAASFRLWLSDHWFGRVAKPFIDWLASPWETDHCYLSWRSEILRRQLPFEYHQRNPAPTWQES